MTVRLINVEATTRCNFTCAYCWGRHLPQEDADPGLVPALLDAFPDVHLVDITGEGEPLLHRDWHRLVSAARERGVRVSLYSNGSVFTDENVARLLALGVDSVVVSIDSVRPERFQAIRGGSLERVEEGLGRLLTARAESGGRLPTVGLASTLHRSDVADLDGLAAFYRRLGLDGGIDLQVLNALPRYARWYPDALQDEVLSAADEERAVRRLAADPTLSSAEASGLLFNRELVRLTPPGAACPWLESALYVRASGLATPCCMIKDEVDGFGVVGQVPAARILAARAAMRSDLQAGRIPEPCGGCPFAEAAAARPRDRGRPLPVAGADPARLEDALAAARREEARLEAALAASRARSPRCAPR